MKKNEDITKMNNELERKRIGAMIAERRREKGLTVRALAENCGVGYANINKIEHGAYNVGIDILSKIAAGLDMRITFEGTQRK